VIYDSFPPVCSPERPPKKDNFLPTLGLGVSNRWHFRAFHWRRIDCPRWSEQTSGDCDSAGENIWRVLFEACDGNHPAGIPERAVIVQPAFGKNKLGGIAVLAGAGPVSASQPDPLGQGVAE
jgi:hypothetical protein